MNTLSNNQLHQQQRLENKMNTGIVNDDQRYQSVLGGSVGQPGRSFPGSAGQVFGPGSQGGSFNRSNPAQGGSIPDNTRIKRDVSEESYEDKVNMISAAAAKIIRKHKGPITNCKMRRIVPRTIAVQDQDYLERRRLNNAASKRSRDQAKIRTLENARKFIELEKKNKILKEELIFYGSMLSNLNVNVKKESN